MEKIKNILLDRDGTIIYDKEYLSSPEEVELLPNVPQALSLIQKREVDIYIVTNQSGIGRGYFTEQDFFRVQERLEEILHRWNIKIKDTVFCPHHPSMGCECRKPKIGMWKSLSSRHGLHPQESIMVGDKASDVFFGKNASLRKSVLLLTGYGREHLSKVEATADIIAEDLLELTRILIKRELI